MALMLIVIINSMHTSEVGDANDNDDHNNTSNSNKNNISNDKKVINTMIISEFMIMLIIVIMKYL